MEVLASKWLQLSPISICASAGALVDHPSNWTCYNLIGTFKNTSVVSRKAQESSLILPDGHSTGLGWLGGWLSNQMTDKLFPSSPSTLLQWSGLVSPCTDAPGQHDQSMPPGQTYSQLLQYWRLQAWARPLHSDNRVSPNLGAAGEHGSCLHRHTYHLKQYHKWLRCRKCHTHS